MLFPKALDVNRFRGREYLRVKPGIYGVPLDVTNIQMLYNKKLLQKAGDQRGAPDVPEFIEAGQALKRVGISGLVSGFGEMWLIDCFASNYAFNIMGEERSWPLTAAKFLIPIRTGSKFSGSLKN